MTNNAKSIVELHSELESGLITSNGLIKSTIEESKTVNKTLNCFETICEDASVSNGGFKNILSGIPYVCKDNISTKDILSTGSSDTLKDYIPFFDATVIKKLKEAGAVMVGKSAMDELGMGGSGTTGHKGIVKNPWNITKMTGGSSAGSAAIVAAGVVPFALGSDTGDSIRKPAALCGIVGYKPTYGMISRYGLFPFAASLDHVGVMTRNVEDAAIVVNQIKGIDQNDMTTWDSKDILLNKNLENDVTGKKLFYIKEICDIKEYDNPSSSLKETLEQFQKTVELCQNIGIKVEEVSIDKNLLEAIYPTYLCISCAEATSNYSNLTGIIFGPRGEGKTVDEMIKDHRTKGFCSLIKRRFIIGSYVLLRENQEKFFLNACRVRRLIVDRINELLKKYDGLILPCSAGGAKEFNASVSQQEEVIENHLAIGNFGGFPSITIPSGFVDKMPIGINITGKIQDDTNILNIAYQLEKNMDYKNQVAKEWK